MPKVITLLGTRPEIIRLSRVIALLDERLGAGEGHILAHTGQNYDDRLDGLFFRDLNVRKPDEYMGVRADTFGAQVAQILEKSEALFVREQPDAMLILGDTNTGLAAFIAKRMGIPVYHMEAGNRCYDDTVPEEVNRRVIDHSSDVLLPYTFNSARNLEREGIEPERIIVTGNPIKEVLDYYAEQIEAADPFTQYGVKPGQYILVTAHRAEMTDVPHRLAALIDALGKAGDMYDMPVLVSLHPRTRKKMDAQNIVPSERIKFFPPMGLFDFVRLEKEAFCVLSDSGTVQEECCIFGVPTVTMRDVTERPETIECGSNVLGGVEAARILPLMEEMIARRGTWTPPEEYLRDNVAVTVGDIMMQGLASEESVPEDEITIKRELA
ncbi:MAG: UDP-N-acetylglucosamine 2-epimerase (non-hydrolyzing) [Coriobacteriia bacterium]|nr:UDP-N-acetylglucosamine 2-epimerase (non-hydrolyzing) [Coriobacteriia bacterium]